jgi:hypothetical protein
VQRAHAECAHTYDTQQSAHSLAYWKQVTTQITTPNEEFYRLYRQSVEDMAALPLPRDEEHPQDLLTAAGVPWFVAAFGRDSLIASLRNIIVFPDFAEDGNHRAPVRRWATRPDRQLLDRGIFWLRRVTTESRIHDVHESFSGPARLNL